RGQGRRPVADPLGSWLRHHLHGPPAAVRSAERRRHRLVRTERGRAAGRNGLQPTAWRRALAIRAALVATTRPSAASLPAGGNRYDGPWTWTAATTSPLASAIPAATDEMPIANSSWTHA